jgi:hypothetical protein
MQKNVIADTSLYYQLAKGTVRVEDIVARGESLVCSPLSIIEIVTKMDEQNFEYHRAAIKAMVNLKAKTFPDPHNFLANNIFGLKLNRLPYDWLEVIRGVASAADFEQMKLDIIDPTDFKKRTLSIDHTRQWREVIDEQWLQDIISILRDQVVNFEKVHKAIKVGERSSMPILRKDKDSFLDFINSPQWYIEHLGALYQRALLYGHEPSAHGGANMPLDSFMATLTSMRCYLGIYSEFLKSILSKGRLPKPADSGVLELMIYLVEDSNIVATADSKWQDYAKCAGFENRVRYVK